MQKIEKKALVDRRSSGARDCRSEGVAATVWAKNP